MKILHFPRRMGKTTIALDILKNNKNCILICHNANTSIQLGLENKELNKRIFSAYFYKSILCGKKFDEVVIDDGDCISLSLLLELINYFQERNFKITITTSV